LQAAFPDYELLAVKQKYGALEFQAFPRQGASGEKAWTAQENADLKRITGLRPYPVTPNCEMSPALTARFAPCGAGGSIPR
jgi:hypothetical protein